VLGFVSVANSAGFAVIVDLHNYCKYAVGAFDADGIQTLPGVYTQETFGAGVVTTAHLIDVWTKLAGLFVGNTGVIFNLMNEPHNLPITPDLWFACIQSVMDAIRATGSTQLILVPNNWGSDVNHWDDWEGYPIPPGSSTDSMAALT